MGHKEQKSWRTGRGTTIEQCTLDEHSCCNHKHTAAADTCPGSGPSALHHVHEAAPLSEELWTVAEGESVLLFSGVAREKGTKEERISESKRRVLITTNYQKKEEKESPGIHATYHTNISASILLVQWELCFLYLIGLCQAENEIIKLSRLFVKLANE